MITQKQHNTIYAAKAFLLYFESELSGTSNPMLNVMVRASRTMRHEILVAEENDESNGNFISMGQMLRNQIREETAIRYGDSII